MTIGSVGILLIRSSVETRQKQRREPIDELRGEKDEEQEQIVKAKHNLEFQGQELVQFGLKRNEVARISTVQASRGNAL